jgi:aryl-alcohol dehydrogenase-like predicted oxidoreductase
MLPGFATGEGTARFRDRFPQARDAGHFRRAAHVRGAGELWLSSVGLGTYLGQPDDAADRAYVAAITEALRRGVNALDTAINYRHQRSERNIGEALASVVGAGGLQRDEVLVCTKAGYLAFDADMPRDPRAYFLKEYVEPGILDPAEVAGGSHCMAPKYLADQLERSRRNLGLETIDVFYVHNPESQLGEVDANTFRQRLRAAFETLEGAVAENKLRYYGVATWNAFRVRDGQRGGMSLEATVEAAREVGGAGHHFRFVQLPYNLGMLEAFGLKNQRVGSEELSALEAAVQLGVIAVGSATLSQGQLSADLPPFIRERLGVASDAEAAVQFSRSTPGVTVSLVGMGSVEHVRADLGVASRPPATPEQWNSLFEQKD